MDISNNTIIPRSPEVEMFKTEYFGGPTRKTTFFELSFWHSLLCCLCPLGNSFRTMFWGGNYLFLFISFGEQKLFLKAVQIFFHVLLAKMHHISTPKPITANHTARKNRDTALRGGAWTVWIPEQNPSSIRRNEWQMEWTLHRWPITSTTDGKRFFEDHEF